MTEKTCAACDCTLDASAIKVKIGARVVEVCCEECVQKLRESIPVHTSCTAKNYMHTSGESTQRPEESATSSGAVDPLLSSSMGFCSMDICGDTSLRSSATCGGASQWICWPTAIRRL